VRIPYWEEGLCKPILSLLINAAELKLVDGSYLKDFLGIFFNLDGVWVKVLVISVGVDSHSGLSLCLLTRCLCLFFLLSRLLCSFFLTLALLVRTEEILLEERNNWVLTALNPKSVLRKELHITNVAISMDWPKK